MIEVREMGNNAARETLGRLNYAHLACSLNDEPYVVPVHYAFDGEYVYIYTTEGKKSGILDSNPKVCLQAEDVEDNEHWISVMAFGEVERVTDKAARSEALDLILEVNPKLTPAVSIRWMDSWVRTNVEVIYRFRPRKISGRKTVDHPHRQ